jgi:hypothetical protein
MFGWRRFNDGLGVFEITVNRLDSFRDSVLLKAVSGVY